MNRLGFYLSGPVPVERVLPLLARAARDKGERLAVVAGEAEQRERLSKCLWEERPTDFLAHGMAGEAHADRQPLLISDSCGKANGATTAILADGKWREEAAGFDRVLLLFDDSGREAARGAWREFDATEGLEREFWALEDGKWVRKL
ncbi:MAG: DNA polymerase III subunit chi [Sphingomonadaceae bacterium]|nr:DNA polymerase III subunit chi [Sphingomonadaceae bacterium]MCP5383443.1 DNA polymerase III subunit chi [Altererythrobacter sp.]MCP5394385.1 DNA polymerase III subunit chi [Sphingomonadaceae bacterium]